MKNLTGLQNNKDLTVADERSDVDPMYIECYKNLV